MGKKSEADVSASGGCVGCIGTIVVLIMAWALIFGVTIGGKHYGVSGCGCDGIEIDTRAP